MFKRKIYEKILKWKGSIDHNPLIITGLRQIGKTSIVKEFALNNYKNSFLLDFRNLKILHPVFDDDFNIDDILLKLSPLKKQISLKKGSEFIPNETVFIFDEIQDCPNARSSLKYFKLDGRFDVISTGSLLGINGYKIGRNITRGIGVGFEDQIEMKPMDFEEFLWAKNIDQRIIDLLKDCVDKNKLIDTYYHEMFLKLIREYICVGGMPKVVDTFIKTNDLDEVKEVQQNLISSFKSDFGVHLNDKFELITNETEKVKLIDIFDSIPKQLAKENKKFQYSLVNKNGSSRTYEPSLKWLKDYGLIDICYNLNALEDPLSFFVNENQFKIYFTDIGLLTSTLDPMTQYKIINNDLSVGKGMIYENLVADAFNKNQKPLYYFSKPSGLEIDFVTNLFNGLYIMEVKATGGNAKAVKTVLENQHYKVDGLIKLTAQNISKIDNKRTIPYYMSFYITSK